MRFCDLQSNYSPEPAAGSSFFFGFEEIGAERREGKGGGGLEFQKQGRGGEWKIERKRERGRV